MSNPVKIAVVGCGYWGPKWLRNLDSLPSAKLVAACDISDTRLQENVKSLYPSVGCYTDFSRMLSEEDIDAVVIATPINTHFELSRQAFQAGKHVFVEKPMADGSAECLALTEEARRLQLKLMVGHTFMFAPAVRKVVDLIRNGSIGDILYIYSSRLNYGRFQKDTNVLWDLAPHDLSIMLAALDEVPELVSCSGADLHKSNPGVIDVAEFSMRFSSGYCAAVRNSWMEPHKVRQMKFVGTKGMLVFDDMEPDEKIRLYGIKDTKPSVVSGYEQTEPLYIAAKNFIDFVSGQADSLVNPDAAYDIALVIEAAEASMKQNSKYARVGGHIETVEVGDDISIVPFSRPVRTAI